MKLLFDQHISFRAVRRLTDTFAEAKHVRFFGLEHATDLEIWRFAKEHNFTVLTKDSDFQQMSLAFGPPPKAVWIRMKNSGRHRLETFLRQHADRIRTFCL